MEACTTAQLEKGERNIINSFDVGKIPLELVKLGYFAGSEAEAPQKAILDGPIYIRVNEACLSIREDMAALIQPTTSNK